MKYCALLAAGLTLAGCSEAINDDRALDDEGAVVDELPSDDPSLWSSAEEAAGSYRVIFNDGSEGVIHLSADGISTAIIDDEEFVTAFTVPSPGTLCYGNLEGGNDLRPQCWVNSPRRQDGTWTRTGESGASAVVSPID